MSLVSLDRRRRQFSKTGDDGERRAGVRACTIRLAMRAADRQGGFSAKTARRRVG
jgi:hypothetical protein